MDDGIALSEAINLGSDVCAKEPIHIPEAIQPHGWLVGLDIQTLELVTKSANVDSLGLDSCLGAPLSWLPTEIAAACRNLDPIGRPECTLVAEIAAIGLAEFHCFIGAGTVFCEFEGVSDTPLRAEAEMIALSAESAMGDVGSRASLMRFPHDLRRRWWSQTSGALAIVAVASLLRYAIFPDVGREIPYLSYYPAVVLAALYGGLRAGVLATIFSALLSFHWVHDGAMSPVEILALAIFVAACLLISGIAEAMIRAKESAKREHKKAEAATLSNAKLEGDIAERVRRDSERQRLSRALRLLSDCNLSIVHAEDEQSLLHDACRLVVETGGYLMAWVGFAENDAGKSVRPLAQSGFTDGYLEEIRVSWDETRDIGGGPVGVAIRTGVTQVMQHALTDPNFAPWWEKAEARGFESCACLPLNSSGKPIGGLAIYAAEPDAFGIEEVGLLEELARNLAFGIETLRTRSLVKTAQDDLAIAAIAFNSQEGMVVCDKACTILRVNQAFTNITGYSSEEAVGRKTTLLKSGRHDKVFYAAMWDDITRDGTWNGEIWNRRKNGEIYPEWLHITAVKDGNGTATHYVGTFADITERKAVENQIRELAFYDPLTRLPNRRLLTDRLRQALAASERNGRKGALLFVDLDNFKAVNDTQGHETGDLLLQQVAERLTTSFREADTVARIGGDEFVIVLSDLSEDHEEAAALVGIVGEKILAALGKPYKISGRDFRCTPSVGITLFGGLHCGIDELMKQADIAMYQSKSAGRNTFRFFDPVLQATVMERASLEADLHEAILKNQFVLHYQAQVVGKGRLTGAEVLVRWLHPERGMVSPGAFIPLAEETGLILPLGGWVLETACAQLATWADQPKMANLIVAVNVSARQFHQPDFVDQVLAVLKRTGADPRRLKLELTESMLVENVNDIIGKMSKLKAEGVGFSLDDFGTGYSSLAYLKRLPLDQLKIDQSFVHDVLDDANDATIARTIVALAQSFGLAVIAEGVETEAQREFLGGHGCHAYQGYFFSRPLSLESFEQFVESSSQTVSDDGDHKAVERGSVPVELELLRGTRVLLVEDDPVNRMIAVGLLEAAHIQTDIAMNGAEAVAMAGRKDYEVVLMDIQMPVMDGLMATRRIREDPKFAELPIIAMAAGAMSHDREACVEAGMSDFIGKPFSPEQLYSTVQKWATGLSGAVVLDPDARAKFGGENLRLPTGIEGLDIRAGLRRVVGMKKLYLDTLRSFLGESGNVVERIRGLINAGDIKSASRAVHTLKGAAGMIEAREIHGLALAVEQMLDGGNVAAGLALIDRLESKLTPLLKAIRAAVDN